MNFGDLMSYFDLQFVKLDYFVVFINPDLEESIDEGA